MFFAAAILVDGASNVLGAVQHREKDGWWIMLLIGILGRRRSAGTRCSTRR